MIRLSKGVPFDKTVYGNIDYLSSSDYLYKNL